MCIKFAVIGNSRIFATLLKQEAIGRLAHLVHSNTQTTTPSPHRIPQPPPKKKKTTRRGSSSSSSGNARDPYRSYQKPSNRTRVSQNTMYDFRFVPEEPDDDDDEKDLPKIIRRRPSAKPAAPEEFDEEETSPKASMGDTKPYTSPSKPQITEDGIPDVDLSAIRQQISEEVQRIYEDDQTS